ncbi:hypothetical protein ACFL2Q_20075 [Thermodesulfobacteriota bacterium]
MRITFRLFDGDRLSVEFHAARTRTFFISLNNALLHFRTRSPETTPMLQVLVAGDWISAGYPEAQEYLLSALDIRRMFADQGESLWEMVLAAYDRGSRFREMLEQAEALVMSSVETISPSLRVVSEKPDRLE